MIRHVIAVWALVSLPITWILYRIVMRLEAWHDAAPRGGAPLKIAKAFVAGCVVWDALVNLFPVSVLFLDFTIEGSISQRLRRLVNGPDGWRKRFAIWVSETLLNPYSPNGPHIQIQKT